MRSVVLNEVGSLSSLAVLETPTPEPGDGQVLVEIRAAGASFVDALQASGGYQFPIPAPYTPGGESAGVIAAIGAGVQSSGSESGVGWAVGDHVVVSSGIGGFSSHILANPSMLIRVPQSVDFVTAASFLQVYGTAWFALNHRTVVRPGETMLVTGAGGGVGLAAIDVAVSKGARVIAVASTADKRELAMSMGAFAAIDSEDDVKTKARELTDGKGIDLVYDVTGGPVAEQALRALRFDGRYLVIGFTAGIVKVPLNLALLNNRTIIGVEWGGWVPRNRDANAAMIADIVAAIADGTLHPVAASRRPLEDAQAVLEELIQRRATGKIVLVP
jgi:NADPH:quinone reductase